MTGRTMFIRFALCFVFSTIAMLCVADVHAQWKSIEPSAVQVTHKANADDDNAEVKFRPSPRFQTVQLPAPVDSTATGAVAPVTYSVPMPAVRGQDAAQVQSTISQGMHVNAVTTTPAQVAQPHVAQTNAVSVGVTPTTLFQPTNTNPLAGAAIQANLQQAVQLSNQQAVQQAAAFTSGDGTLPNDHGQVWREYDISPYTLRVQSVDQPEQALVDWIIRETGTQVWFSDPLGILSANRNTLRVYHTPEMQAVVKDIVDRFVGGQTDAYSFGVRLLTVNNPNWRESLHRMMRPVSVQTPGIQAWIMSKEDAALFVSELSKRTDYREYNSTNLLINNGQKGELAHVKPTSYIKNILSSGDAFGSYQPELGEIKEGYNLSISPLVSNDGSVVDCVIKCSVDQVEELVDVNIDVPTQLNPGQQVRVQVPQLVSWRVHERFRWPANQVLVVSCGVVAKPGAVKSGLLGMRNVPNPFEGAPRADAMMILESRGTVAAPLASQSPAGSGVSTPAFQTGARDSYHGRY